MARPHFISRIPAWLRWRQLYCGTIFDWNNAALVCCMGGFVCIAWEGDRAALGMRMNANEVTYRRAQCPAATHFHQLSHYWAWRRRWEEGACCVAECAKACRPHMPSPLAPTPPRSTWLGCWRSTRAPTQAPRPRWRARWTARCWPSARWPTFSRTRSGEWRAVCNGGVPMVSCNAP